MGEIEVDFLGTIRAENHKIRSNLKNASEMDVKVVGQLVFGARASIQVKNEETLLNVHQVDEPTVHWTSEETPIV